MAVSPRDAPTRSRTLDAAILGAAVVLAIVLFEQLPRLAPDLPRWLGALLVGAAGGLLGMAALRYRDFRQRRFAGQTAERTRAILDSAVDAIITIDESGQIESANPATTQMFGHSQEQLVGRNVTILMPQPYRDEHPGYLRRYLETGQPHLIGLGRELVALRANGEIFPIHLTVSEARVGTRRLFTGIVRDLSEPRHAQAEVQRLGEILDESLNEIYVFDARTLRYELANRGACENLRYSLGELKQLTPLDLQPELTAASLEALLAPLRSGQQKRAAFKTLHRRKDGSTYRIEVHLQHSSNGGSGRFLAIIQDITERETLEIQLAQAQKLEAIGQLAGGIAHDFNNLLTSIQGSSELLAARLPDGDRSQRALDRIHQAAERGAALTRKLLAFGRRGPTQLETLDLGATVAQVSELTSRLIGEDIEVHLDLSPDLDPIRADRTQIDQIVLNLVVNASDAMPGGGKLTLATRNLEMDPTRASRLQTRPGRAVELRVEDTGVGMTPEVLSHIFEPFFTTKEIGKGTGLGLATVYGIVRQNAWGIEVDSESGRGSVFRILIPRAPGTAGASEVRKPRTARGRGGETVLLVEDDALLRDMATEILEAQGYRVLAAPDPETALGRVQQGHGGIALLIADVVMPQMTGLQLAARLRERQPDLRVLFMSGYAPEALQARGALPSDPDLLHKPFSNEALIERIRAVLDTP